MTENAMSGMAICREKTDQRCCEGMQVAGEWLFTQAGWGEKMSRIVTMSRIVLLLACLLPGIIISVAGRVGLVRSSEFRS